jgi:hypothetical protein
MLSQKSRAMNQGPSMTEVVVGAALSLVLGVVLAMAYLVAKPVQEEKQIPKDLPAGTICYIVGEQDANNGKQWLRKKQLFTEGTSVTVNEDELNAWIQAGTEPAVEKPAPGKKAAPTPPPPAQAGMIQLGTLNFRIRDGLLQMGSRGTLSIDWLDFKTPVVVQATGRFAKSGGAFAFVPERFYIGSCPLHKLPFVGELLLGHLIAKSAPPEDIATAWKKLADVSIAGKSLNLTMP